jgi:hypothetical protein
MIESDTLKESQPKRCISISLRATTTTTTGINMTDNEFIILEAVVFICIMYATVKAFETLEDILRRYKNED